MRITPRDVPPRAAWTLEQAGVHPLLARLYAARGVQDPVELDDALSHLPPPDRLRGATEAAELLADAMRQGLAVCIVADYDCDGATACATAWRGLRLLGAPLGWDRVRYLVPDRVRDGYGLTPALAERVKAMGAHVLVTVDNGIASLDGVAHARALGLQVLITDHHLPLVVDGTVRLPADCVIVNPNQPGCPFPSKAMAGVGVVFYVLLALRALLRQRGVFNAANQPRLDALLPLVALGTVADVVRLDAHNRRLVAQGLKRIRAGAMPAGMAALLAAAGRAPTRVSTFDLGFALGPRLNAAGRLSDMGLGIECLITDDPAHAGALAQQLDAINRERRSVESAMREQALLAIAERHGGDLDPASAPPSLTVFDPGFHEGVVGIVAARLKDRLHRPVFVFAPARLDDGTPCLKGSGRSIAGFHLRDALDAIAKRDPGLLLRFGGHAMAAGCTLPADGLAAFDAALRTIAGEWLDAATLQRRLETDGALPAAWRGVETAELLDAQVWGQGFAAPLFSDEVAVLGQRIVGERHLSLRLRIGDTPIDGIWFGRTDALPATALLAYRLAADEWQGQRRLRLIVEGAEA
ncbi:single-stranded-DNA-specific exonuclease RecJ [Tepidimonas taiwanensis]|uniref:Single-stranded-DNA-specific exonuclease RecJ n=1 Tax=Tepidimonas taiwanensis TaxID=307486 RepID=A0A554X1Z2_9BURK|nr:single-stranded-DNA-specific exonuclease RecJ [Tepidimonas taiwanensis]MCX7693699.1 single-stranded-DNA-specific exonuclease RecJ [Tepidimonas taiwanensis]MDM7463695.1 single-stranded-DNA-specific exonuclease RecJ [Tepidimonas taiwanensis]TSE29813.1 Single-stranded-DNA-specific exonuclease RecJ [Tepidimonas taiwanensis]UBQ04568.1 single-stranded-DNA-specific exonuclease RecJ [Tepidimonas taiwanensis]